MTISPMKSLYGWLPHSRTITGLTVGVAAPAAGLAALGSEVLEREPLLYEQAAMLWLHAHTTPALNAFAEVMNVLGGPYVAFPLMALLPLALWVIHKRPQAIFALTALWSAVSMQWLLKLLFGRPRPELWANHVHVSGLSFPSGHATAAAALALVLTILAWRTPYRWATLMLGVGYAALMALSRVVLGVHYPSDVLAGVFTATACVSAVYLLQRRLLGGAA